jgi:SAM-dependent methyltransferase
MAIRTWESEEYHSFWDQSDFAYLDRMERRILGKFIGSGTWFIDIGGGYGRLMDLYKDRFRSTVISDYSLSMLEDAERRLLREGIRNVSLVATDAHALPFVDGAFDSAMMVRLVHHIVNPAPVIQEARRIIKPGGAFLLEYQNKRNIGFRIKAGLGLMKRRDLATLDPLEAGPMYWIFHPQAMERLVSEGFALDETLGGGIFWRRKALTALIPRLELIDSALARFLGRNTLTHQLFMRLLVRKDGRGQRLLAPPRRDSLLDILKCPKCGRAELRESGAGASCAQCNYEYPKIGQIYDFRVNEN